MRKDATFSLGGRYWEVPAHLRGQIITIAFDPVNYVRVEIMMGDRVVGRAAICDKHRNAKLSSSNDYDREPF